MRRVYVLLLLVVASSISLVVGADDFWIKKSWQDWSQSDCSKMLQDSPWSKKFGMSKSNVNAGATPHANGGAMAAAGTSGESNEEIFYFVQLRSALPVRQAMVRQMQIKQNYDKMSPQTKKEFDESTNEYLARVYADNVVVHVVYDSNIEQFERKLAATWQGYSENSIPLDTHLILPNGDRINPVRFISPRGSVYEFELIFPREVNGKPIIDGSEKSVGLEFPHPSIGDFPRQRVYVEFKPDKMTVNGKLIY